MQGSSIICLEANYQLAGADYSAICDWSWKLGLPGTGLHLSLEDFPSRAGWGGGGENLEIKLKVSFS